MRISAIDRCCPKPQFTSQKNGYENPINRGTEKGLAIWGAIGGSAIVGATAAGIGSCFIKSGAKSRGLKLGGIGAAAGLLTLALTLPDVFSRDRELKSNIMEEVDKEVKDEDVSLDQKISHYTSVQMANNGNGMLIKGA